MHVRACLMVAIAAGVACGGRRDAGRADSASVADAEAPATDAASGGATQAETEVKLTVADLDAYERGAKREMEVVETALGKLRQAKGTVDTLSGVFGVLPEQTRAEGAKAAGLAENRYNAVQAAIDGMLGAYMTDAMNEQMMAAGAKDSANMPPAVWAQMRQQFAQQRQELERQRAERFRDWSPDVRAEFEKRRVHLDSLRMQLLGKRLGATK